MHFSRWISSPLLWRLYPDWENFAATRPVVEGRQRGGLDGNLVSVLCLVLVVVWWADLLSVSVSSLRERRVPGPQFGDNNQGCSSSLSDNIWIITTLTNQVIVQTTYRLIELGNYCSERMPTFWYRMIEWPPWFRTQTLVRYLCT